MCFSAEASFTVSAALLPAGGFCVAQALRKRPAYLALALIPVFFSAQQFAEGLVWLGLKQDNGPLVQNAALVFLFFAIVFWPFWVPLSLWPLAVRKTPRRVLGCLMIASLTWFWLYFPLVAEPGEWLTTTVVYHSIRYEYFGSPGFQMAPRQAWQFAYLLAICIPFPVYMQGRPGRKKFALLGSLLIAALFLVCYLVFWYAFTSTWCFFAAVLSLLLCWVFFQLKDKSA